MGAGAGCTIEIENCTVKDVGTVDLSHAELYVDRWWVTLQLDCVVKIDGTIKVSSYDHSSGDVEDVAMTVNSVSLNIDIGNGYNAEILTSDAIERFETKFDDDIESIWEQFLPELTANDIDPNYIASELSYGNNYTGSGKFGGGWIGVTFNGGFDIDEIDDRSGYNNITSYSCTVDDDFVIDYLDKSKYGDNIEYTAFYNGDILDSYNELDEAIDALKKEILADVANADLSECYVECCYYYLRNGSVDHYEYESDWDYSEVEYCADDDPDFDFEALADISSELDEENDVGIDEGFDI